MSAASKTSVCPTHMPVCPSLQLTMGIRSAPSSEQMWAEGPHRVAGGIPGSTLQGPPDFRSCQLPRPSSPWTIIHSFLCAFNPHMCARPVGGTMEHKGRAGQIQECLEAQGTGWLNPLGQTCFRGSEQSGDHRSFPGRPCPEGSQVLCLYPCSPFGKELVQILRGRL